MTATTMTGTTTTVQKSKS